MKTKLLLTAFISSFILHTSAFAQGALTPPGAPAATMKSLAQIEPRTPISSLPFNINAPGSYYLTTNLTGPVNANGIVINSGDVTLDLGGFAVVGALDSGSGIFVYASFTNILIRNGTIRGWAGNGVGMNSSTIRNVVIEHLNISGSGQIGIQAYNAIISDCTIIGSGSQGIFASACTVRDCSVDKSGTSGIYLLFGTASHCLVQRSGMDGIYINASGCVVNDNVFQGNNTVNSPGSAGILINDSNNRIENNHVTGNGAAGAGIMVTSGYARNLVIKNFVVGNGASNYSLNAGTISGPLITATGIIASSNPWANFSY